MVINRDFYGWHHLDDFGDLNRLWRYAFHNDCQRGLLMGFWNFTLLYFHCASARKSANFSLLDDIFLLHYHALLFPALSIQGLEPRLLAYPGN